MLKQEKSVFVEVEISRLKTHDDLVIISQRTSVLFRAEKVRRDIFRKRFGRWMKTTSCSLTQGFVQERFHLS